VSLIAQSNEIELAVRDSGQGFDLQQAMKGEGIGLASMHERLQLVDGRLSIETAKGRGTLLRAQVPLGPRTDVTEGVA
jgi:signal transduction histidine kinase